MHIDDVTRSRILDVSREYFFRLGFSKVTMSEIATELGMSKKTLYEYFQSKEELLSEVISSMQNEIRTKIDEIIASTSIDFVEKMRLLFSHGAVFHSKFSNHFLLDIQKNAPQVWKSCDDFRMERMRKNIERLVKEGIANGVFRSDLNEHVLVVMYINSIQQLVTPQMLEQLPVSMKQLFETIITVLFEGILTEEARSKNMTTALIH